MISDHGVSASPSNAKDSVSADKKRLAEVNRMIRSYENQTKPSAAAKAASPTHHAHEEDDYLDDPDFAASGEGIEESIEVEEDLASMSGGGGAAGNSMNEAEYFASGVSEKGDQRKAAGTRSTAATTTAGRRANLPPSALDSHESIEYDDRDPADLYSEDASVNEPLEQGYDYTEDIVPVSSS